MLRNANPMTVLGSAMVAATLDLPVVPTLGLAYIVPYKGQAQFQLGYKGLIELAERSGQFKNIIDEVKAHATRFSQAFQKGRMSPWKSDFDAMARKTVLKALFSKYAPKSVAIQQAIKFDQAVVKPTDDLSAGDINIDAFEKEYVDYEPQIQDATAEEVDPSKGLFGDTAGEAAGTTAENKKGK